MKPQQINDADRRFRSCLLWVAIALWCLFAASSYGKMSSDPMSRYDVSAALIQTGQVGFDSPGLNRVEFEGRYYNVFFPGQVVQFLPAAAVDQLANRLVGLDETKAMYLGHMVACTLMTPVIAVLGVIGLVLVLRRLGIGDRWALLGGVLLGVATPWWHYAATASEEVTLGTLLIWAVLQLQRMKAHGEAGEYTRCVRSLGVFIVLLGCAGSFRSTVIAPGFGLMLLALAWLGPFKSEVVAHWRGLVPWCVSAVLIVGIVPAYNAMRFGHPLDTGYARFYADIGGVFTTPLHEGLVGHLFSPGKSYFLHVPVLVLLCLAYAQSGARRAMGWLGVAVLLTTAGHLLIYSKFVFWSGEFCWATRFHTSLLPLLMIPVALSASALWKKKAGLAAVLAIAAASVVVQVASVSLNFGLEHNQNPEGWETAGGLELVPGDAAWTWELSPLRKRFENIANKLQGKTLIDTGNPATDEIMQVWSVFPARAGVGIQGSIVKLLWGGWLLLIVMMLGASVLAYRCRPRAVL